jgi:hypothetical protein
MIHKIEVTKKIIPNNSFKIGTIGFVSANFN